MLNFLVGAAIFYGILFVITVITLLVLTVMYVIEGRQLRAELKRKKARQAELRAQKEYQARQLANDDTLFINYQEIRNEFN